MTLSPTVEIRIRAWAEQNHVPRRAVDQVIAYAMAHRSWINRFGLPTRDEVRLLRGCYSLFVASPAQRVRAGRLTAAEEWAIISKCLHPSQPDGLPPEAYYRVVRTGSNVQQTSAWIIVDRSGARVLSDPLTFGSCSDATRYLDAVREART